MGRPRKTDHLLLSPESRKKTEAKRERGRRKAKRFREKKNKEAQAAGFKTSYAQEMDARTPDEQLQFRAYNNASQLKSKTFNRQAYRHMKLRKMHSKKWKCAICGGRFVSVACTDLDHYRGKKGASGSHYMILLKRGLDVAAQARSSLHLPRFPY